MYLVFIIGVALWLTYGVLKSDWPVVAANAVTLLLAIAVLSMKFYFDLGFNREHAKTH